MKKILILVILFFSCSAVMAKNFYVSADFDDGIAWKKVSSSHFNAYYEGRAPTLLGLELERVYSALRFTLADFAVLHMDTKISLYIYKSKESYLNSKYNPQSWSNAIAIPGKRAIVLFNYDDMDKFRQIVSHESTHILFDDYVKSFKNYTMPPLWILEGIAVLTEDNSAPSGVGDWSESLSYYGADKFLPLKKFMYSDIKDDSASEWYLQAFATVKFMNRSMKRIQFKRFCDFIVKGTSIDKALQKTYMYSNINYLERELLKWISEKKGKKFKSESNFTNFNFSTFKTGQNRLHKKSIFKSPEIY
jgi:hypothetical protein